MSLIVVEWCYTMVTTSIDFFIISIFKTLQFFIPKVSPPAPPLAPPSLHIYFDGGANFFSHGGAMGGLPNQMGGLDFFAPPLAPP